MSNCKWQEAYDWALHNPKETDSGEPHWPFGETWDTWSRGKSRWLPINITNESTVQHLHSCKPQPKIAELNKKRLSWNEKQLFSNTTSAN